MKENEVFSFASKGFSISMEIYFFSVRHFHVDFFCSVPLPMISAISLVMVNFELIHKEYLTPLVRRSWS